MSAETKRRLGTGAFSLLMALLGALLYFLLVQVAKADTTDADAAAQIMGSIQGGNGWMIAAAVLSFLVSVVRKLAGSASVPAPVKPVADFLRTDRGGVVVTAAGAVLGGVGHAVAAGMPVSAALVDTVPKVLVGAIGGFVGMKKLVAPSDRKAAGVPAP